MEEVEEAGDLEADLDIVVADGKEHPEVAVTAIEDQDTIRDLMVAPHTEEAMEVSADEGPQVQVALDLVR